MKISKLYVSAFFCLTLLSASVYAGQPISDLTNNYLKNFVQEQVGTQLGTLSEFEKRSIISNLFYNNEKSSLKNAQTSDILNNNILSDLNLLSCASDTENHLFSKINFTTTTFGEMHLLKDLATPIQDSNQLRQRQDFLKKLIGNRTTFAAITKELETIKQSEASFLKLWGQDQESVKNLFFKRGFLKNINKSATALSAANNAIFMAYWAYLHNTEILSTFTKNSYAIQTGSIENIAKKIAYSSKDFINYYGAKPQDLFISVSSFKFMESGLKEYGLPQHIAIGLAGYVEIINLYLKLNFYKTEIQRRQTINQLQEQLAHISAMLRAYDNLTTLIENDLDISLPRVELSQKTQNLVQELHGINFQNPSMLYFEGKVLACYHEIKEIKDEFANIFIQIGHIDAYVSTAKLYQSGNDRASFCFTEYIDNATRPIITAHAFWNMFIDPTFVVTNDIVMDKNIILTGPNAGGKSTSIKALLQNLLLSQTFGIAAAQEFVMTPFTKFSSYLNITDDLSSGKSLFMAEVDRAKSLVNTSCALAPHQFGFCVIDELFTGTSAEAGEDCAYSLTSKLGTLENSIFLFATHYQKLTMQEATSNNFANYKVNAPIKVNGKLKYPFTLEKGINTINIAKDILDQELVFA